MLANEGRCVRCMIRERSDGFQDRVRYDDFFHVVLFWLEDLLVVKSQNVNLLAQIVHNFVLIPYAVVPAA